MPKRLSVDELVLSDSFINYCFETDRQDILYWQQYLKDYPGEKATLDEAKKLVFLLKASFRDYNSQQLPDYTTTARQSRVFKIASIAAACIVFTLGAYYWLATSKPGKNSLREEASIPAENALFFSTHLGAKQTITLPDGTIVYLNSGSTLRLEKGFGQTNRQVFLVGEGGFDVKHNEQLPFTVSVAKYDVHVIGTFFNVRAYPGDKTTETSLLRGKVDILIKDGFTTPFRMSLKPQQKFVMDMENTYSKSQTPNTQSVNNSGRPHATIEALSYNRDSINIETAWMQNKLIIEDESFEMMKEKLERWFNVKIVFKDEAVTHYPFNATFKGESIDQVLQALQASYFFNYEIKNGEISISK